MQPCGAASDSRVRWIIGIFGLLTKKLRKIKVLVRLEILGIVIPIALERTFRPARFLRLKAEKLGLSGRADALHARTAIAVLTYDERSGCPCVARLHRVDLLPGFVEAGLLLRHGEKHRAMRQRIRQVFRPRSRVKETVNPKYPPDKLHAEVRVPRRPH